MLKKLLMLLSLGIMLQCTAWAKTPVCVLMKFTDDTRFDLIESGATLADMVMLRLVNSGKFNLRETEVIPDDMEKMLYEERAAEFVHAKAAMVNGDYDTLFEGPGFDEKYAQSMATARLGQIVDPKLTSAIGRQHGADYLIQASIINMGTGGWWDENFETSFTAINYVSEAMAMMGATNVMGFLGPLGSMTKMVGVTTSGIGVQTEVRVIEAVTGEVVWQRKVTAISKQTAVELMGITVAGTDKLSSNLYYKAMEKAANMISDALIGSADRLFGKT